MKKLLALGAVLVIGSCDDISSKGFTNEEDWKKDIDFFREGTEFNESNIASAGDKLRVLFRDQCKGLNYEVLAPHHIPIEIVQGKVSVNIDEYITYVRYKGSFPDRTGIYGRGANFTDISFIGPDNLVPVPQLASVHLNTESTSGTVPSEVLRDGYTQAIGSVISYLELYSDISSLPIGTYKFIFRIPERTMPDGSVCEFRPAVFDVLID